MTERKKIEALLNRGVDALVEEAVEKAIGPLGEETQKAITESVAKVQRLFDNMTDTLLGTDHESRRQGKIPIPDLVESAVNQRRQRELWQDADDIEGERILREMASQADCRKNLAGHCLEHKHYSDDRCPVSRAKELIAARDAVYEPAPKHRPKLG